ncbi:MAG: hypothetical protein KKF74_00040 [Nanoarchaeota archaeon]|nr:hypothetical protein [Nanoarchaeota archaeon]
MLHIRSNSKEQKSNIAVLTEIVKNMKVPEGILTHVLETHTDNYNRDYHYDVCEFLAEAIELSDNGGFYLLGIKKILMNDAIFPKLVSYESLSMINLGLAGRFNDKRNAEIAKNYSSFLTSFCKKQSTIISEKENDIVFNNAYKIYLKMPLNEEKSIREEYANSLDLVRYHINLSKDTYDYLAKKHEFILDNFSYLNEILVKYFEKKQSIENLIDNAYKQNFNIPRSEDFVLDRLNLLDKNLNKDNDINFNGLKNFISGIQEDSKYLELDSNNINQAIKKILVTKITSQLNRLENLL